MAAAYNYWDEKITTEAYGIGCAKGKILASEWYAKKLPIHHGGTLQHAILDLMDQAVAAQTEAERYEIRGKVVGFSISVESGNCAQDKTSEDDQTRIEMWPVRLAYLQKCKLESEERKRAKVAAKAGATTLLEVA